MAVQVSSVKPCVKAGVISCGGIMMAASIAVIVVASLGLSGAVSSTAVNITSLVSNFFNPCGIIPIIVAIIGLSGGISSTGAAGVALGFGILSFMMSSAACCGSSLAVAADSGE